MKKLNWLVITLSLSFVFGCAQEPANNANRKDVLPVKTDSIVHLDNSDDISKNWTDSVLEKYLLLSSNELVRASVDNKLPKESPEEWLFDQVLDADTAKYLRYQIGHDVADEGGANPRFVTDQWVYLDTVRRILYEYDLPNDSLIRWSK